MAFITSYSALYGANQSLLNLLEGLAHFGVLPYVIAPQEGYLVDMLRQRQIAYALFPIQIWVGAKRENRSLRQWGKSKYEVMKRLRKNLSLFFPLIRQLREWNIDIVYTNTSISPIGIFCAKWLGLPHVWHIREFADLHYNLNFDFGKYAFQRVLGWSDVRVAISKAVSQHVILQKQMKHSFIVYNGVAWKKDMIERFARVQQINKNNYQRSFTFAIIGLIHPAKGQDIAIQAFSEIAKDYSQARLLIVGDGDVEYKKKCEELVAKNRIDGQVEFCGFVREIEQIYFDADVILMCSRNEAMGRVTVEAMTAGRPVIGYAQGGTLELIEHEYNGLLYNDFNGLVSAMRRLLKNPDFGRQLGKNGWKMAKEKFTIEEYASRIYNILDSLVLPSRKN